MSEVMVTDNYQLLIPKNTRKRYGLKASVSYEVSLCEHNMMELTPIGTVSRRVSGNTNINADKDS